MDLLRKLTLIYTAVLVSALGSSLVAILVQLWRIAGALGEVREVLEEVRDETAPLGGHLQAVHQAVVGTAQGLGDAGARLGRAEAGLGPLAPPGPAQSSS